MNYLLNRRYTIPGKKITRVERNITLSMIFGSDVKGRIKKDGTLYIQHKQSELDVLKWKHEILSKFLSVSKIVKSGTSYHFTTVKSESFLKRYRKILYSSSTGKKNFVREKILNKLDEFGLSVWILNSFSFSYRESGGTSRLLSNTKFHEREKEILSKYFPEKWGIVVSFYKYEDGYRLVINSSECEKLFDLVYVYLKDILSMKSKMDCFVFPEKEGILLSVVRSRKRSTTSREQRMLILEMLIGDGHLDKDGRISLKHSKKQEEYLEWKRSLLVDFLYMSKVKCRVDFLVDKKERKSYTICTSRSGREKFLKLYREVLYPNNKKKMYTKKILSRLSSRGLAIWYMDDGNLFIRKNSNYAQITLNTYCSKEEAEVIVDFFSSVWKVNFRIRKHRGKYIVDTRGYGETCKFLDIIRPYVKEVPCMGYKLGSL
jgi:hypothetical protein